MKKHQLLEKAMRDYPAGTNYRCVLTPKEIHCSTGQFFLDETGSVAERGSGRCIYSLTTERWAEPVKPSILDGKVAIQVNNEREFKLLMQHYESKGWRVFSRAPLEEIIRLNTPNPNLTWSFHDEFYALNTLNKMDGYTIIPFADFAAEVGITVPKFIMKSEDGVDLYEGDDHSVVTLCLSGEWSYAGDQKLAKSQMVVLESNRAKAFSTREAAEKWIEEQNRPKEFEIEFKNGSILVTKDWITFNGKVPPVTRKMMLDIISRQAELQQ